MNKRLSWFLLALILTTGIFLRIYPFAGFHGVGFDENLYRSYVTVLQHTGLSGYPDLCEAYLEEQKQAPLAELPPTRSLYIISAWAVVKITGLAALPALHLVSCAFSIFILLISTAFAYRLKGVEFMVGVTAFMAFMPTQIHMGQHALIDGVFATWAVFALWTLWESLRAPGNRRWLVAHALGFAGMILTKENAIFAAFGFLVLMLANRWLHFGTFCWSLLAAEICGGLLALAIMVNLAGNFSTLLAVYHSFGTKLQTLQYAIQTGDGPWHRYLVDLMIVSPIILLLALGAMFQIQRQEKALCYCLLFVVATYVPMCNLRNGMNLRYANMWDLPLCMLAFQQMLWLAARWPRWRHTTLWVGVAVVAIVEFRQYWILFVQFGLYELVTEGLLRAVRILK